MKTLDSILGKFTEVKNELVDFVKGSEADIAKINDDTESLKFQIRTNDQAVENINSDIKRAGRSIKQINKLIGGK